MPAERSHRIEQLFHAAPQRHTAERAAFLERACAGDDSLRLEVESLLAEDDGVQSFLETPALEVARNMSDQNSGQSMIGRQFGPYSVVELLAKGGMGEVYRALDTRLGRAVAIKISAEEFSKRFEREARVISALNHPHICTLHDIGSLPSGASFMVTELVDGETLSDWLRRAPAVDRSIEVARQVLEALRAAHSVGIIHRDLKPANIMVRFDGYVKVLDFGLAKRIPATGALTGAATAPSAPNHIMGTVAYMSPEQILGQDVDARSDLFALGIILYEMIGGVHPWTRE